MISLLKRILSTHLPTGLWFQLRPLWKLCRRERGYLRRALLSYRYLRGRGLEIGALNNPLPLLPFAANARYADRLPVSELRGHYPELGSMPLAPVDVIMNGETLEGVPDRSLDFIVANHMLEHCENPLRTLENFFRKLAPGGVLYCAIPDKRFTFDLERELTSFEHIEREYHEGAETNRQAHFLDCAGGDREKAAALMAMDYSIHFHVWDHDGLEELFRKAPSVLKVPWRILAGTPNPGYGESIFILRKS